MKRSIALLAAAAAFSTAPAAEAQGFLKGLRQAAEQAVRAKAPKIDAAVQGLRNGDPAAAADALSALAPKRTASPDAGAAPAADAVAGADATPAPPTPPAAARRQPLRFPHDIAIPEDVQAQKVAFLAFSRYSCTDCEGGHGYDAWAALALNLLGPAQLEQKVGAMAPGGSLRWRGHESDGTLTVVEDATVEGFDCKKVEYRLTRRAGGQSAARPGLFCFGLPEEYVTQKRWVDVY